MTWQALAGMSPLRLDKLSQSTSHALSHALQADHHHHVDASIHFEAEADQLPHHHTDDGVQPTGWLTVTALALPAGEACSPKAWAEREHPTVFLEGPLRPPQTLV